jgi:hypothetical protein
VIYTYDFTNKLIYITRLQADSSLGPGVLAVTLLSDIRQAEASYIGMCYAKIVDASGGESLGGSVSVGVTLNLLDSWQIVFETGTYIAKISAGNLVGGKDIGFGKEPIAYSSGVQVLLLQSASSTTVTTSTGSGLSTAQDVTLTRIKRLSEIIGAVVGGKVSGADTPMVVFRDLEDTKDVITANVDSKGNRTSITYGV